MITQQQARIALDNMDDYARMGGIVPSGAFQILRQYIEQRAQPGADVVSLLQRALTELAPRVNKQCCGRTEWRVMNKAGDAYCMSFDHSEYINPERAAREWLEKTQRERPGWIEANGYHIAPKLVFTDAEKIALETVELLRAAAAPQPQQEQSNG